MAKASKAQRDKLVTIRERYKLAYDADRENRECAIEDMKFCYQPGEQWEASTVKARGDRPTYEFNKVRISVKRVVNDMRANRPAGKVRGQEDGDKDTADVYEGLIRNIWGCSDGDTVIDAAAEYQVACGMGAWRVVVDYESSSSFDQDIRIEAIRNPFNLWPDPAAQDPMRRDARFWIYTTKIPKSEYEAKYKSVPVVDFDADTQFDDEDDWDDGERVRICEYWYREAYQRTLLMLADGRIVDSLEVPEGAQVIRSRTFTANRIRMCIASGEAILEEAEWAGEEFPFVMVYGEHLIIDGKPRWYGLVRYAKDAQRAYNYSRTLGIESVALAPQAKYWATPKQADGHQEAWSVAHRQNMPYMLYNADAQAPGTPQRMPGADIPAALVQEMQISSDDIKAVTGIFDASLGARSNETAGVAIRARQSEGQLATFNYMDNLGKAIRRTWEIVIGLIPQVYDTPRAMRILGQDGAEKYVTINQPDPVTGEVANDLSRGKYDVTVTVGPSWSTRRQEAAEVYAQMAQAYPPLMQIAGDLMMKASDVPYSDEIAERFQAMLPPQIQQMQSQGKQLPPEAMAAMAQASQAMQMVQQQGQMLQQASQEIETGKAELATGKAEIRGMLADLKTQQALLKAAEAELDANVARAQADLAQKASDIAMQGRDVQQAGQQLTAQAENSGQQMAAEIVQQALQAVTDRIGRLEELLNRPQPQPIIVTGGGKRIVRAQRGPDGSLMGAEIEDSD